MDRVLAEGGQWPGAVAVSGGADSLALMFLLADWAAEAGLPPPVVLTVDHALQAGSNCAADDVAALARRGGLVAHILHWRGRKPRADIERAARDARYRLMGDWCRRNSIGCVFVAHSMDDQAETFLLRLMRGSGVDGLAAMTPVGPFPARNCENLLLARPLLSISRTKLRGYLVTRGQAWSEDKMNSDMRFARVRLRKDWPTLRDMGFSVERIAAAARHLARARGALNCSTADLLKRASRADGDTIFLDSDAITAAPEEIGLRAIAQVLMLVSGQHYRPRFDGLERLIAAIRYRRLKGGRTLHGCCIRPASKRLACFGAGTLIVRPEDGRGRKCGKA